MLKIGAYNKLEVSRIDDVGSYLKGKGTGEILLPLNQVPDGLAVGDELELLVFKDSNERLMATTSKPKISLDSFACLEVLAVEEMGAYFDMGLAEGLWVPDNEQNVKVHVGDKKIVHMFLDEPSESLMGSIMWREFCFLDEPTYEVNQKVEVMIGEKTNLGRNVLIEKAYYGLIYTNEIFEELNIGDVREAYIKTLREDGDIDISLQKLGYGKVLSSSDKILELLKTNEGVLDIGDKSSPDKIVAITGMSKKTFKKAIGDLYRKKLVSLDKEQVKLNT